MVHVFPESPSPIYMEMQQCMLELCSFPELHLLKMELAVFKSTGQLLSMIRPTFPDSVQDAK